MQECDGDFEIIIFQYDSDDLWNEKKINNHVSTIEEEEEEEETVTFTRKVALVKVSRAIQKLDRKRESHETRTARNRDVPCRDGIAPGVED